MIRDICNCFKDGNYKKENIPESTDEQQVNLLNEMYSITEMVCLKIYFTEIFISSRMTREEVIKKIMEKEQSIQDILIKIHDQKDYSELIWNKVCLENNI